MRRQGALMRRLGDISIRYKLVAISTLISVAALVVASGALIAWDQVRSRTELSNNLQTLTKIVAENSTAAVSYFDTDAAVGTLQAIRAQSGIEAACIFDRNGLFAKYAANEGGACPSSPGADGTFLSGTSLWVVAPIVLENQRI